MLGGSEFENVQPRTTGRGTVSILTVLGTFASAACAWPTHTASWIASSDEGAGSGGSGLGAGAQTSPTSSYQA
jgi:hypothetical protein